MQPIELYSMATSNGKKVAIALEEMNLPYRAHTINILEGEQLTDAFVQISPNGKIPAIVDPQGPDGKPIALMESGAILLYLANKSGQFLPESAHQRAQAIQWLFW